MKFKIYSIGKVKQHFVLEGEEHFIKQLRSYCDIERIELPDQKIANLADDEVKKRDSETLLSKIKYDDFLIVLDLGGKQYNSEELSSLINDKFKAGTSTISFAIGGALGWSDAARKRANILMSLSRLTFPHQIARLLLIEQIYRALSIIKGTQYHK